MWLLVSWPECYRRGAHHHPAITIPQPDPLSQSLPRSISSCLTISASTSSRKGLSTPKISSISHPKISSWHVSQISPLVDFLFTDQHWPQRNHNPPIPLQLHDILFPFLKFSSRLWTKFQWVSPCPPSAAAITILPASAHGLKTQDLKQEKLSFWKYIKFEISFPFSEFPGMLSIVRVFRWMRPKL